MSTETPATATVSSADLDPAIPSTGESEDASSALAMRSDNESPGAGAASAVAPDSPLAGLPLQLDVTVAIPSFRVEDLLTLEKGAVLESHWHHADDVPVWCGGAQLAWTEFEVVDNKLAVRLTRVG